MNIKISILLGAIIVCALGLRIMRCAVHERIDKDSVVYVQMAEAFADDGSDRAFERNPRIPPLYIIGMAAGKRAGFDAEGSGRVISLIAGTFLVLAVFILAFAVFKNSNYALTAAFLAAIHPFLIRISSEVMRDSLFIMLATFSVAFAVSAAENPCDDKECRTSALLFRWMLAGIFAGLAVLTRSEGGEIVVAIGVWCMVELTIAFFKYQKGLFITVLLRRIVAMVVFLLFFAVTAFPLQVMLDGTSSEWSVVDYRIVSFMRGAVKHLSGGN